MPMQDTPAQAQMANTSASAAWEWVKFLVDCGEELLERTDENAGKLPEAAMRSTSSCGCQGAFGADYTGRVRLLIGAVSHIKAD